MKATMGRLAVVGFALANPGCDDSSSHGVDTGLSEAALLRELSADDAARACRAVELAVVTRLSPEVQIAKLCELSSTEAADDTGACRAEAQSCIEEAPPEAVPVTTDEFECDSALSLFEDCAWTVGQLEACAEAAIRDIEQALTRYTCDDAGQVTRADLEAIEVDDMPLPEGCAELEAECALGP